MATAIRTHTEPVMTLPGRYYYDQDIFEQEQEHLFSTSWVCVAKSDTLPVPGHFLVTTVGVESVIVTRAQDGSLKAMLNVCRHRGARVCVAEQGRAKTFQCRYHAWGYGLDGELLSAPNMEEDPDFDRAEHGLHPVALTEWAGFIWLNLSDHPGSFAEQLGFYYDRFVRYQVETLKVGRTIEYDVKANWKLLVENFNECCHCGPAHPELSAQVPSFKAGIVSGYLGGGALFEDGIESLTVTGKTNRPFFPGITEADRRNYYGMTLRPNVFLNLHPDYVLIHIMRPMAADRTKITCHWLFTPEAIAQPDFEPEGAVDFWDLVNRQDWEICELTQQGVRSKSYRDGGLYAPLERHIRGFNDYVLAKLGHDAQ
jgi:Rieske 2Fe-2S family protein